VTARRHLFISAAGINVGHTRCSGWSRRERELACRDLYRDHLGVPVAPQMTVCGVWGGVNVGRVVE